MAKKVLHFLSTVFFYSIMAILCVVVIMFLAYFVDKKIGQKNGEQRAPLFGAYVIISESMIPSINVYDAVVTVRVKEDKIKQYDIITFLSKDIQTAGTPITHRVVGIVDTDTGIKYRTKGDHNNTPDFALISPEEVIGRVYLRIPMIGYLQTLLTKPLGWALLIVIPCLLIIGGDLKKLIKISGKAEENKPENKEQPDSDKLDNIQKLVHDVRASDNQTNNIRNSNDDNKENQYDDFLD